jgi:lipopolysaccharide export system permease protein
LANSTAERIEEPPIDPVRHRLAKARKPITFWDVLVSPLRLILHLIRPKLVDRYVLGELLAPFAFGMILFLVLFVTSFNLFKLAQMAARGAPVSDVMEMLGLRCVQALVYCLPMAMLLAGLMAFGRLSGDSEIVAIQAGGIPTHRLILANALPLGILVSILGLGLQEFVLPPVGKRLQQIEDRVKKKVALQVVDDLTQGQAFIIQDMEAGKLSRLIAARKFEPGEEGRPATLKQVTYIQYEQGKVAVVIQASRADWIGEEKFPKDKKNPKQVWRFYRANVQFMANVTRGQKWVVDQDEMDVTMNKSPVQMERERKDADQMTYRELQAQVAVMKAGGAKVRVVRELEVEMERKLSLPWAALVLALVGSPLGIRKQRTTAGVGIGLSLIIIILYYLGMNTLAVLGQNGKIGPVEAAWGCNIIGLLVGLYLTWRTSR